MRRTTAAVFGILLIMVAGCGPVDDPPVDDSPVDDASPNDAGSTDDVGGAEDDDDPDTGPQSDTRGGDDVSTGEPTLDDIFQEVFVDSGCTAGYCHGGAVDELLMSNSDTVYGNSVSADSEFAICAEQLVVPGEPENSELWYRVRPEGMHGGLDCEAPKMPKNSPGLDEETAQLVYDWIAAGAKR